ncbi:DMT family transporter [Paenibacillus sp. TRM 82003]|nr:DMT family transporter [Paenibacillus sp. TRM 82003]
MIVGVGLAIAAGALVGLQNVFNSKVNERAGTRTTTAVVLGMGFMASLLFGLLFEGAGLFRVSSMQPWFWFSGLIGVGVVTCLVQGIRLLGPTYAVAIAMTSQLGFALLWDTTGWLGLEKLPFTWSKLIGVLVIVAGIVTFKLGDASPRERRA